MLCLYSLTPNSFTSVTPESLLDMVIPLVGTLVFGAIGIAIFSVIAGKFLGYSVYMSIAIGMCALMGYPGTQIVTDDVVNALSASSEEKAAVSNVLLPRMLVGGFTTVSIGFGSIRRPSSLPLSSKIQYHKFQGNCSCAVSLF